MGIPTLISTATASNDSAVSITSGIDSTYDEYMFVFTDINPATDNDELAFQVNAVGETGFNEYMTTTFFEAQHSESGTAVGPGYESGKDQAQGTAYQQLTDNTGNGSDECVAGVLHLFNPASTTYVKHFYARTNTNTYDDVCIQAFTAGYINTTAAIDEISFTMFSGGNFDGVIQMYGIA